mgnify:CR=1 FL=1
MPKTIAYIRVSSEKQTVENQKLAILDHCNRAGIRVDEWLEVEMSSRKNNRARRIDELIERLKPSDTLIVSELSRLARSVGQIAILADTLLKKGVRIVSLKENIDLKEKHDMQSKVMVTMFSLFSEIERDLISERTKEGLIRARADGKRLGRPKGSLGRSKLDGLKKDVENYLQRGISKTSIAKLCDTSWGTLNNFIKSRGLGM